MDHLPSILTSAAEATAANLASLTKHAREKVAKLTAAFEKLVSYETLISDIFILFTF